MAIAPTVIIVSAYTGEDYFNETKAGYSEQEAYSDILNGQIEHVRQVLLISEAGCDDITARIAGKIARYIEGESNIAESAAEFAAEFGGYVMPEAKPDEYDHYDFERDRRRDDAMHGAL